MTDTRTVRVDRLRRVRDLLMLIEPSTELWAHHRDWTRVVTMLNAWLDVPAQPAAPEWHVTPSLVAWDDPDPNAHMPVQEKLTEQTRNLIAEAIAEERRQERLQTVLLVNERIEQHNCAEDTHLYLQQDVISLVNEAIAKHTSEERPVTEQAIAKALYNRIQVGHTGQNCSTCLHRLVCACEYYGHDNCHYVWGG